MVLGMEISLEQAKVFEAVARLGTIQKVAQELRKTSSAVIYSLQTLEDRTGITLLDRSGYRNRLTREGEVALKFCRQMLEARRELNDVCRQMKQGWEPSLKLVYDGIVDFDPIGDALLKLHEMRPPTEIRVLSAHLGEVETLFAAEQADIMVTILPLEKLRIPSIDLPPIQMHLVAHADHPLARRQERISDRELNRHTFIQIKTGPNPLGLGTEQMQFDSYFYVNGFAPKKAAIVKRLGFGWLPDYLIRSELLAKELVILRTEWKPTQSVFPRLYHRSDPQLGKAARELIRLLANAFTAPTASADPTRGAQRTSRKGTTGSSGARRRTSRSPSAHSP